MMITNRYFCLLISSLLVSSFIAGQIDTNVLKKYVPPLGRQSFHLEVDNEQKNILKSDGKDDKLFIVSTNDEVNYMATKAATLRIDWMQYSIEKDTLIKDQRKVRYLRGLTYLLRNLQKDWRTKEFNPNNLPSVLTAYERCVDLDKNKESIFSYIQSLNYETATPVVKSGAFDDNITIKACRYELVRKICLLHPDQILYILKDNPDVPFADSLVKTIARAYPRQLYDYAQTSGKIGNIIRNINDDVFIKAVVRMARSKSGQQYFPFLDNIVKGKMTFESIDSVKDDSVLYYRLLVNTHMDYVRRAMNGDSIFEARALNEKMEGKALDVFVTTINGLHTEEDPNVRFKIIQSLNPQELYYLAVSTDGIIYTSSFVKGVYPLMMKKINGRGDSLLTLLSFDKYRRFIKMAAGYNTLGNFLGTFPKSNNPDEDDPGSLLMRAFVKGLEKTNGPEDAVDVADSYASIAETIKPIADEMLNNVQRNYKDNVSKNNRRGIAIYNILNNLFLSADTMNKIDLTKELGIPPVYEVPFKSLANDSGRIIIQIFIYGDKDGIGVFPGMLNLFNNANWKIDRSNAQWATITSIKGKPVTIYANKPLPEETDEDAKAQEALCTYLEKNKLYPTVTVNRGHSYNAPYTIKQMFPSSKIVFMGSCGGYRMIHDILEKAPDAHIIGTRQIADVPVNNPFLKLLSEKLRTGNNIDWIPFWKELDQMVTDKIFEDYVPPYKNLGALFIKAYKIAMDN